MAAFCLAPNPFISLLKVPLTLCVFIYLEAVFKVLASFPNNHIDFVVYLVNLNFYVYSLLYLGFNAMCIGNELEANLNKWLYSFGIITQWFLIQTKLATVNWSLLFSNLMFNVFGTRPVSQIYEYFCVNTAVKWMLLNSTGLKKTEHEHTIYTLKHNI